MEELRFINKVWISPKEKAAERVLKTCCWVYLFLDMILMLMEGIRPRSVLSGAAVFFAVFFIRSNVKRRGHYTETECRIRFEEKRIQWDYPGIDLDDGKGMVSLQYDIDGNKIKNISVSHELRSIRLECSPLLSYGRKGVIKTIDYKKGNRSCVLILYYDDMARMQELINKYIHVRMQTVD